MSANANNSLRSLRSGLGLVGVLAWLLSVSPAMADEPVMAAEPKVLEQPGEVTAVVDAMDDDDPFDLWITLGYQHTWKHAKVMRESYIRQPGLTTGGYTADTMNVADYSESTSRLNTRLDVGLYKDLALYLRMPIILNNSRQLASLDGSAAVQDVVLMGAPGEGPLFTLPFDSPDRSGIEYLAVGVDVNIMNQARDPSKPTWLFGIEGRFNVSEPMHACGNKGPNTVECAYPSDVNRNGVAGDVTENGFPLEGNFSGSREPGVSRGTTGLELHTIVSKRVKYVEPYAGFLAQFEFPTGSSDYGLTDLEGSLVNHPPIEGTILLGTQIIPWENREQFQRLSFDLRAKGTYRSEGRDYSELFDALGSSNARSLRNPNYASFQSGPGNTSVVNTNSQRVYVTGLTDVQAHGMFNASGSVSWQAAKFVKFQLGVGYTYVQSHFITMDQPCNPDLKGDVSRSGPCRSTAGGVYRSTGVPNPNYRAVINQVGRRFRVDDVGLVDLWINGVVMF